MSTESELDAFLAVMDVLTTSGTVPAAAAGVFTKSWACCSPTQWHSRAESQKCLIYETETWGVAPHKLQVAAEISGPRKSPSPQTTLKFLKGLPEPQLDPYSTIVTLSATPHLHFNVCVV